jgi:hypothetical protein
MKKIIISTLLSIVLFIGAEIASVKFYQSDLVKLSISFYITANILKLLFLILLAILMYKGVCHLTGFAGFRILLIILCIPFFFVSCTTTLFSGREILNMSRPSDPNVFIKDKLSIKKLTDLGDEMIKKENVFWVGNNYDNFIFSIKYSDANYQFDSSYVTDNYDFNKPLSAEDMSKVHHPDISFINNELEPTNSKLVYKNDFIFCKKASKIIRKIGFDNIKLYPEFRVIQYQIYDFLGWDAGGYIVYYYCPDPNLPKKFEYSKKLNDNWYYIWTPRFSK